MTEGTLIRPLHGLRGLAAMSVVVGHVTPLAFNPSIGVVLFFVLSGYLIGKLYFERGFTSAAVWDYGVARFARIYPLFALVIVATVVINSEMDANIFHLTPGNVLRHLALAGAGLTVWTISVEFQFYAVFVLLWVLRSRGLLPPWALIALLAVLAVIGLSVAADVGRIALPRYLFIFVAGMALAQFAWRPGPRCERLAGYALPLFAAGLVLVATLDASGRIYDNAWATIFSALLVLCAVSAPASWGARWLSTRPLFWLGEISFGIYLLHRHGQRLVGKLLGPDLDAWLQFGLVVAVTLIAAQVAHLIVERPARLWLRSAGSGVARRLRPATVDPA